MANGCWTMTPAAAASGKLSHLIIWQFPDIIAHQFSLKQNKKQKNTAEWVWWRSERQVGGDIGGCMAVVIIRSIGCCTTHTDHKIGSAASTPKGHTNEREWMMVEPEHNPKTIDSANAIGIVEAVGVLASTLPHSHTDGKVDPKCEKDKKNE